MATTIKPGDQLLCESLKQQLNAQMLAAAEPLINSTLVAIERAMRERLAAALIARIDQMVTFHSKERELVVTIRRQD